MATLLASALKPSSFLWPSELRESNQRKLTVLLVMFVSLKILPTHVPSCVISQETPEEERCGGLKKGHSVAEVWGSAFQYQFAE